MTDNGGTSRYEWERLLRRCLLPGTTKAVGFTVATWANGDGSHITAGVQTIAAAAGFGERATRTALADLRRVGLLERVSCGSDWGRNGYADEHRLAIPTDLLERVEMLPTDTRDWPETAARAAADRRAERPVSPAPGAADERPGPVDITVEKVAEVRPIRPEHRHLVQGTPAPHAGTPASDDRNTGTRCRLPTQIPSQLPEQLTNVTTRPP